MAQSALPMGYSGLPHGPWNLPPSAKLYLPRLTSGPDLSRSRTERTSHCCHRRCGNRHGGQTAQQINYPRAHAHGILLLLASPVQLRWNQLHPQTYVCGICSEAIIKGEESFVTLASERCERVQDLSYFWIPAFLLRHPTTKKFRRTSREDDKHC